MMEHNETRESQWQETLDVAAALRADRATLEPNDDATPGAIYLCRRTADFPVEWLVIADAPDGRRRVVPVDDYPLVGSHDVDLSSLATGSAAVARCDLATWTEPSRFETDLQTRMLDEDSLERVRSKRRDIESDSVAPSLMEEVADGDLDYELWVDGTLRPAVEALNHVPELAPVWPRVTASVRHWAPLALAAGMALAVLGLWNHVLQLDDALSAARGQVADLETQGAEQQKDIEEGIRHWDKQKRRADELEELLTDAKEALADTGESLEAAQLGLRQALDLGAVTNLDRILFGRQNRYVRGTTRRGAALIMKHDPEVRALFEVEVVDPEPYFTYRLRIVPLPGKVGEPRTFDGIRREGGTLRLTLGGDTLAVGDYEVLIDGVDDGAPTELAERYRLTVVP